MCAQLPTAVSKDFFVTLLYDLCEMDLSNTCEGLGHLQSRQQGASRATTLPEHANYRSYLRGKTQPMICLKGALNTITLFARGVMSVRPYLLGVLIQMNVNEISPDARISMR